MELLCRGFRSVDASELFIVQQQAIKASRSAQVCKRQCRFLGELLKMVDTSLPDNRLALEMTMTALDLLRSCNTKNWIWRSLLRGESREEFQLVLQQLCDHFLPDKTSLALDFLKDAADQDLNDILERSFGFHFFSGLSRQSIRLMLSQEQLMIDYKQLRIKEHLAAGAFSALYEGRWLGHSVVIKYFARHFPSGKFHEQLEISKLKHPNIVSMIGYSVRDDGQSLVVMEKMTMDLGAALADGHLKKASVAESVSLMLNIATGMSFLHSKNIMHRDLKPANILINYQGEKISGVKICDFAISKTGFDSGDLEHTALVGTKAFMAPEVMDVKSSYTKKADVFSFSMLCYVLLCGEVWHTSFEESFEERARLLKEGVRPEIQTGAWPRKLIELIRECWSSDPCERPAFTQIVKRLVQIRNDLLALGESERDSSYWMEPPSTPYVR